MFSFNFLGFTADAVFPFIDGLQAVTYIVFSLEWLDQSNFIDGYASLDP